ncbi:MAG TPA: hypothetical protein VN667_08935 [Burkholderiales bacterium]|nr:hypothetical protein [Burkholderiales bacterium]
MESNNMWESVGAESWSCGESSGEDIVDQEAPGRQGFDYEILGDEISDQSPIEPVGDQVEDAPVECDGKQAVDGLESAPGARARDGDDEEDDDAGRARAANPFALLVAPDAAQAAAKNLAAQKHARRRHSMDTKPVKPLRGELAEFDAAIDREEEEPEGQWGRSPGSVRSAAGMVAGLLGH